jgi:hypothetical protein
LYTLRKQSRNIKLGEIYTSDQTEGQRAQPIKIVKQPVLLPIVYIYVDESCFYFEELDCKRSGILPAGHNRFVHEHEAIADTRPLRHTGERETYAERKRERDKNRDKVGEKEK